MYFLKLRVIVSAFVLFGASYAVGAEFPYTLEGKDCSMTVLETGFLSEDGGVDIVYYNFFGNVTISSMPDVLFRLRATSPNDFIGESESVRETLHVYAPNGIWGPIQLNGALYHLENQKFCRTLPFKQVKKTSPDRP